MTLYIPIPIDKTTVCAIKNTCDRLFHKIFRSIVIVVACIAILMVTTLVSAMTGLLFTMILNGSSHNTIGFAEMFTLPILMICYIITDIVTICFLIIEFHLIEFKYNEDQPKDIMKLKPL